MWLYSGTKADNRNGFSVGPVVGFSKVFRALFVTMFKERKICSKNHKKKSDKK